MPTRGAANAAITEPAPLEESSSDENVRRARKRADAVPAEVQQAALAETMRYLGSMSRVPFRKVLAELVGAKPTPEAVRRFADKYPDRWAQAVSMMAGLAGYDRGVIELNLFNVKGLPDATLMAELQATRAALAKLAPKVGEVVDAEVVEEPNDGRS